MDSILDPAARNILKYSLPIASGLLLGGTLLWRLIEFFLCMCVKKFKEMNLTMKRRALVAKLFFQVLFLVLGQMTVPLAQFCIDNLFLAEIPGYLVGLVVWGFVFIQIGALSVTYFFCIRWVSGEVAKTVYRYGAGHADKYQATLSRLNTAAISLFDEYRWGCRYWTFVEAAYDILNCVLVNTAQRTNQKLYWLVVGLHIGYCILHFVVKPSHSRFHNWFELATGGAHILNDIAVLEGMYGNGKLTENAAWVIISAASPLSVGIIERVLIQIAKSKEEKKRKEEENKDEKEEEEISEFALKLQGHLILPFWALLSLTMAAGSIFLNVAAVIDIEPPSTRAANTFKGMSSFVYALLAVGLAIAIYFAVKINLGKGYDEEDLRVEGMEAPNGSGPEKIEDGDLDHIQRQESSDS
jgi:hypothetical protein